MNLSLSFCTLLAGLLLILSVHDVDALPISKAKRSSGMITLPLKRLEQRSDIHPQLVCLSIN